MLFLGAAGLALALFALVHERQMPPWPPPLRPTLALLYLALLGSVVVFAVYFYLLKRLTLMAASTLVFIEPVLALLIDAVWEQEIRLAPGTLPGRRRHPAGGRGQPADPAARDPRGCAGCYASTSAARRMRRSRSRWCGQAARAAEKSRCEKERASSGSSRNSSRARSCLP